MARKTTTDREATATLIYSYGCKRPKEGAELYQAQMRLAHRYRNELTAIERERRARVDDLTREHDAEIARLQADYQTLDGAIEGIADEIKARRKKHAAEMVNAAKVQSITSGRDQKGVRPPRTQYPELTAQLKDLKARRKAVKDALSEQRARFRAPMDVARKEYKRRVDAACEKLGSDGPRIRERVSAEVYEQMLQEPQWCEAWKAIDARCNVEALRKAKAKRAEYGPNGLGLSTGNYKLVEDAAKSSAIKAMKLGRLPAFRRDERDGFFDGRFGDQVRSDATAADVLAGNCSVIRFRDVSVHGYRGGKGRQKKRALVDVRCGVDADGQPRWASFPVVLHRPLPDSAVIKYAWVKAWREGDRRRYALQLTVNVPRDVETRKNGEDGAVALHLAWRQTGEAGEDHDLRVGYVVGTDGLAEPVELPTGASFGGKPKNPHYGTADCLRFSERLRSGGDVWFDHAVQSLTKHIGSGGDAPPWVAFETRHMPKWHAHAKLAKVAQWWASGYSGYTVSDRATGETTTTEPAPGVLSAAQVEALWSAWKLERIGAGPYVERESKHDLMDLHHVLDAWFLAHGVSDAGQRMALFLEWWRRKDVHLRAMETASRERGLRQRKDAYRKLWSDLAARYKRIVVCTTRLDVQAKRAAPDQNEQQHEAARSQRTYAAPGELRALGAERFGKARLAAVSLVEICAASTCCVCGAEFTADASSVIGRCSGGHTIDRDRNAALNMLVASGDLERSRVARIADTAREAAE